MITIKCAKCHSKIFKYKKIGKGRILHCWKEQIKEDYSIRDGNKVKCKCGNLIGLNESKFIRMKQNSFTKSGTTSKK